jgi:sigma-B regulation protein RsbU (phosphoserine phosphatase)
MLKAQKEEIKEAVRREAFELQPLFEFSNIVNSSLDLDFILNTILRTLMGKLLIPNGMVLLTDESGGERIVAAKGFSLKGSQQLVDLGKLPKTIRTFESLKKKNSLWSDFLQRFNQKLVIPVFSQKRVVGVITLGDKLTRKSISPAEKKLIQSLVNLSGAAVEKAAMIAQLNGVNRMLDRKVQELNTLFDLSKEFNIGLDIDRVIRLLTFALLGQIGVKQYAICMKNGDEVSILASKNIDMTDLKIINKGLCELEKAQSVSELLKQKRYRIAGAELLRLGIIAAIPMRIQQKTQGMILVGKSIRTATYTPADLEFLFSLGNLAIISIENARLFQSAIEKQRMEDELKIAREIQQGLLPEHLPKINGFDIAAINIPSKEVGGDYYDVIKRKSGEYVLAIGDVSGKGTPASLLMANVQAVLRALAPSCTSVSQTTGQINDLVCSNIHGSNKFITFFWGILDPALRSFVYSNAGHNPPLLIHTDKTIDRLGSGGLILGIYETTQAYEESAVEFSSGDVLVLYTDGISEAMNSESKEFSEEALETVIKKNVHLSAQEIISEVRLAVEKHTKDTPQSDDITLLILKAI